MPDPEALTRITIDRLLTEAGWTEANLDQLPPTLIPAGEDQAHVVIDAERLSTLIDQLKAKGEVSLKLAESLRQAILRQAFSGETTSTIPGVMP